MVSATITTTDTHCGGILGHGGSTENTTIQDCLFNGTINGKDGDSTVGVIWGWQTYGHANIISCLENGTYTNCSSFNPVYQTYSGPATVTGTYYVTGSSTYGTQATTTTLSDGTVTAALNASRTGDAAPWVQDPVTNLPQLKLFASNVELTAKPGDNAGEYWATYYHQYAGLTADANTTVYTGAVSANKVMLTEVNDKVIPADNAVILKSTSSTITLTPTNASGTLSGNVLLGMQTATTAPTNAYCLSKGTSGVGFYAFTGTIPANRSYLVITSIGNAPQYLGFDDNGGTTGVNEMRNQTEKVRGEFFDLQGRRILNPTKGLYIVNGRKVIIK